MNKYSNILGDLVPKTASSKDICRIVCFNKVKVDSIKKKIFPQEKINNLVEIFNAISDNTRMKTLLALREGELCVCDIAHVLGMSLSAVSHQLRILRGLRLVKYRNDGRMVFYSLTDRHVIKLIQEAVKHIKKS